MEITSAVLSLCFFTMLVSGEPTIEPHPEDLAPGVYVFLERYTGNALAAPLSKETFPLLTPAQFNFLKSLIDAGHFQFVVPEVDRKEDLQGNEVFGLKRHEMSPYETKSALKESFVFHPKEDLQGNEVLGMKRHEMSPDQTKSVLKAAQMDELSDERLKKATDRIIELEQGFQKIHALKDHEVVMVVHEKKATIFKMIQGKTIGSQITGKRIFIDHQYGRNAGRTDLVRVIKAVAIENKGTPIDLSRGFPHALKMAEAHPILAKEYGLE